MRVHRLPSPQSAARGATLFEAEPEGQLLVDYVQQPETHVLATYLDQPIFLLVFYDHLLGEIELSAGEVGVISRQ